MPTDAQIRTALDTLGTHQLAAHECFGGAAAVLRPESVRCMIAPKLPDNLPGLLPGENNAFGCFVVTGAHRLPRGSVYTHGAYGTHALFLPRENLVGILLKNSYVDMSLTSHATNEFENANTYMTTRMKN